MLRDEMANMVWGVEKVITLPDGSILPGLEAAYESRSYFERLLAASAGGPPIDPPSVADVRYRVMDSVPGTGFRSLPRGCRARDVKCGCSARRCPGCWKMIRTIRN